MSDIQPGVYKGRAIVGSEQFGSTSKGNDQIAIDLEVPELGRNLTTFLVFSTDAAPYSIDRLRACGWDGSTNADGSPNLATIGANEIDVQVKYRDYNGEQKLDVQIMTGGGRVKITEFDASSKRQFGARFSALAKMHGVTPSNAKSEATDFPFGANRTVPFGAPK